MWVVSFHVPMLSNLRDWNDWSIEILVIVMKNVQPNLSWNVLDWI